MIKLQNVSAGYGARYGTKREIGNVSGSGSEHIAKNDIKEDKTSHNTEHRNNLALHDINLTIKPGEFIALIGPNGSGKSTLLKVMTGQLPVSGGAVYLHGKSLREFSPKERALSTAYFPQSRPTPDMNVATLVAHGRFPHLGFTHVMSLTDRETVKKSIELTALTELENRALSSLSGGERQRAYLAMLIAQEADIFLLDEPGAFLDIRHQLELMDILKDLNKLGKTIILAAHDLPLAFSYAMRIVLLENGNLIEDASPESLSHGKSIEQVFGLRLRRQDDDSLFRYILAL